MPSITQPDILALGRIRFVPGTVLCLEIDLQHHACVNLDFPDRGQRLIPLHLSLRREAGLIVVNRTGPLRWRREIPLRAVLQRKLHDLHLAFDSDCLGNLMLTLWLDGHRLARLDAYPRPDTAGRLGLRRGLPGLSRIGWVSWPDGLRSLRVLHPQDGRQPHLTDRLELAWQPPCGEVSVGWDEGTPPIPFLPIPGAATPMALAQRVSCLPGRIWRGAADGTIPLRIICGAEPATFLLRHTDLLSVLTKPEALWQARHDIFVRLQMLEHVHHAGLWDKVPDPLRALLENAAPASAKAKFAPPPGRTIRTVPAMAPPGAAAIACDAFHIQIAQGCTDDPIALFGSLCTTHGLTGEEVRQLALLLGEWFCLHADPCALYTFAAQNGAVGWDTQSDSWASISALPMGWARGDWAGILKTLRTYPRHAQGWLVAPALGWTATALARDRPDNEGQYVTAHQRHALMNALLDLIAELAPSYWAQTPCRRLIAGVLDILEQVPLLPDWCARRFPERALDAYSLRPEFWAQARRRKAVMALPEVARAARAFDGLERALHMRNSRALLDAASPFLARNVAGHDSLMRVILQQDDRLPDFARAGVLATRAASDEASLRWLARPRSPVARAEFGLTADEPVHHAACAGLRSGAQHIARPPFAQASARLAVQVNTCLADIAKGTVLPPEQIAELQDAARALCVAEAGFLGVAALLGVAEAAVRKGLQPIAEHCILALCERLVTLPALPGNALVPRLALDRFAAFCPDARLVAQLRACLPRDPSRLTQGNENIRARAMRAAANPFADTVVALISCRQNLATRVPAVKAAWGDALGHLGIPLVTVVGRAPDHPEGTGNRFDGELLELDAPDDYEGLPQKSLALAEWVLHETGFARVLKIDDDCFLDAAAYFGDPTFMIQPYYGRPLWRGAGSMDRGWHSAKAQSDRGRLELDKSPEPAVYADGSTAYLLARPALQALSEARQTPRGRALEQVSFMEDKLIGDLLSLSGIEVAGPNYDVAVFRRAAPGLAPVSQYENSFLPFKGSGLKVAHLDCALALPVAEAAIHALWPSPMKVWPSMVPARTGWATNALDLVTPPERLEGARLAEVAVIAVMRNERAMLRHFLSHYRRLGAGAFLIVDNGSDDGTLEQLVAQPDVSVFSTDTPYRMSTYGVQWQEALMAHFRLGRWSLLADADELAFWRLPDPDGHVRGDLPALLRMPDFAVADAVRLFMLDMYPKGRLSQTPIARAPFAEAGWLDAQPLRRDWQGRGPWSNCDTVTSALRHRLMDEAGAPARANLFVAQKYALLRYHPLMRLSAGLHYITGACVSPRDLAFGHFKYHAAFHAKAEVEVARSQHFNNAEEYRNYLALRAEVRDILYDASRSVALAECRIVREICAPYSASKPNPAGMRSQPPSTRSAMICASAGAIANPILNPPLNT